MGLTIPTPATRLLFKRAVCSPRPYENYPHGHQHYEKYDGDHRHVLARRGSGFNRIHGRSFSVGMWQNGPGPAAGRELYQFVHPPQRSAMMMIGRGKPRSQAAKPYLILPQRVSSS